MTTSVACHTAHAGEVVSFVSRRPLPVLHDCDDVEQDPVAGAFAIATIGLLRPAIESLNCGMSATMPWPRWLLGCPASLPPMVAIAVRYTLWFRKPGWP